MVMVSVIVPAYNAEKTLGECLDSLLHQDYNDYEVIVVDDGSTDNTGGVAESYQDEKLVYIRQPNGGVSVARNTGISHARGEYVMFCDADDCVSARYVRTMMENADGDALVICASTTTRSALDTEDTKTTSVRFHYLRSFENLALLQNVGYVSAVWCKLFKKSVIQRHGLQFDQSMCIAEDRKFVYEYLYVVKDVVYVNQILYFYNRDNSSLTRDSGNRGIPSFLAFADFLSESLEKGNLTEASIKATWYQYMVTDYVYMSIGLYASFPYAQARMLQTQVRSHPFMRSCIENCPWERMNNYPGMGRLMKFLAGLNNVTLWRLAGCLKRWRDYAKGRTRKK